MMFAFLQKYSLMKKNLGKVIWITGLSGSGKTTISAEISDKLIKKNLNVITLDGDKLREIFATNSLDDRNFNKSSRIELARKYSKLCKIIADQGYIVVIATISMFNEIHNWNRANLPGYFEIYMNIPLKVLFERDPKGLYKKYSKGKIKNIAGLDLEVDEPKHPDFVVMNYEGKIESLANNIIKKVFLN